MVSAETLENSSVCAAVSAMALTTADATLASFLIAELEGAAERRLQKEGELGRAALTAGGDYDEERLILATWTQWYLDALRDHEGHPGWWKLSAETLERLEVALDNVKEAGRTAIDELGV